MAMTVKGARTRERPVHVCGGIASEPAAAPLLVGLGVTELSVSIPAIGAVKAALARWTHAECEALAAEALEQTTAADVRALLASREPGRQRARTATAAAGA
jgi:phosphoenolpyruvate-protein kinase (PTS system EI component)